VLTAKDIERVLVVEPLSVLAALVLVLVEELVAVVAVDLVEETVLEVH
jgi:hypothetical protein